MYRWLTCSRMKKDWKGPKKKIDLWWAHKNFDLSSNLYCISRFHLILLLPQRKIILYMKGCYCYVLQHVLTCKVKGCWVVKRQKWKLMFCQLLPHKCWILHESWMAYKKYSFMLRDRRCLDLFKYLKTNNFSQFIY